MTFTKLLWRIFAVVFAGFCFRNHARAQDICAKFNIGGPCHLLKSPGIVMARHFTIQSAKNPYCKLACSQGDAEMFSFFCHCDTNTTAATTTTSSIDTTTTPLMTTTTASTTTPRPATCFYSTQRPARLSSRSRRVFSSTPVVTDCDYPGVVGLFREVKGKMISACTALLLTEDVLLINEINCLTWVRKTPRVPLYVLADTYNVARVTKTITVNPDSVKKLDVTGSLGGLYTINLSTSLTFNRDCIQPACVPNINIPATDLDLDDCRLVGYGDTTNILASFTPQLKEVKVKVSSSSITEANLTLTRDDKIMGMSCWGDDASPVICSHKTTGEWVTVGITAVAGYPCNSNPTKKQFVTSLLQESPNKALHKAIQSFKYTDPNTFTADSDK